MIFFNSIDKFYKSPVGAVRSGENISFRVCGDFNKVVFLLRKDGDSFRTEYEMEKIEKDFVLSLKLDVGLYFYCFALDNGNFIGKDGDFNGILTSFPLEYQLTVFSNDFVTPNWIKGGVIYQIFPDRFFREEKDKKISKNKILRDDWGETPNFYPDNSGEILNNDFFGGDIKGIISKLGYISSLGVNAIYLNPIFEAYSNHRYDTADFLNIDPLLGTLDDFKNLINEADKFGIKIILDGVFNHTGSDSIYFNKNGTYDSCGAYQSTESPYFDWFKFIKYPNEYESWWGIKTLPATKKDNGGFTDFIAGENGVIDFYTKLGIGGWRLDVVDELPSDFVKKIRKKIKSDNVDCVLIGEVWENASNKISYGERREYFRGKELDSVMNYPLKNAIINFVKYLDTSSLEKVIFEQIDNYPADVLHSLMNILATHDTFRLFSALSNEDISSKNKNELAELFYNGEIYEDIKRKVKVASLLQFTLCGVPCIYYGDEIGMQGYSDPLNRRCYPWGHEDEELLSWYNKLGEIRNTYFVFEKGSFVKIYSSEGFIVFKRYDEFSELMISANVSNSTYLFNFNGKIKDLLTGKVYENKVEILPESCFVFIGVS